jgi:predicted cupin superfamily sugar epimerase
MREDVQRLVKRFELQPHPEGGWFRETMRTEHCTTIYYLLPAGHFSAWHRVIGADEVWHHYAGDLLALHVLDASGARRMVLGEDHHHGVVPAGSWQAATPLGDRFSLVGCTVAPAFEFSRFELGTRAALTAAFPQHERLIARFTRPTAGTPEGRERVSQAPQVDEPDAAAPADAGVTREG